ncbi:hypothetical protein [Hyphococcus sp.]|uniref:hypothetical protein n=1 Tax=Hyphococcus sp. TaxID=2038636 RepID=UPI0035C78543
MKLLVSLSAAQTVLLAALGLKVFSIDMQIDDLSAGATPHAAQAERQSDPAALSWETARAPSVSVEDMRLVIREELAALDAAPRNQASTPAQPARPQPSPEQVKHAVSTIDRDISLFRNRGAINEAEMATLQAKIAKLPLAERRAALSTLTKAMSKGEIDGWM